MTNGVASSWLLLLSLSLPLGSGFLAAPGSAREVVPKRDSLCPLGYVDLFNGKCSTLGVTTYPVKPERGEGCRSGWISIGGGYCRRK